MPGLAIRSKLSEHAAQGAYVARWLAFVTPVAVTIGSLVALFLWSLERATEARWDHPWLLWMLPVAGLAIGLLYHAWGGSAEGGNNLIVDEIHEPGGGVPRRMAPLVLVGTIITHLFGGSAGREGTAVQMGGSVASAFTRWFRLDPEDARTLLTTGVAAGFGAVFGTPITGAVFALEVLAIGRLSYGALIPCLLASLIGDWTVSAWGIHHTAYHIAPLASRGFASHVDLGLLAKVLVAAAAFGLASRLFAELAHGLARAFRRAVARPWLRPVLGGVLVIGLTLTLGTRDYLGLGVASPTGGASILASFTPGGVTPWSWWWKLLFTAVTLASGFKGGEVTPLFFIGAALGNTLGWLLGAPVDLFAGLGFIAVFAGATNTPLACTIMGIELFGADAAIYVAAASFLAYLFSGHSGIYLAQRIGTPKGDAVLPPEPALSLRTLHEHQHRRPGRSAAATTTVAVSHFPDAAREPRQAPTFRSGEHAVMSHRPVHLRAHAVPSHPVGQVRIYLTPRDRRPGQGWLGRLLGAPLHVELVRAAKAHGIPHALVLNARLGYIDGGALATDHPEYGAHRLPLCVELIGEIPQVERFCQDHVDLLVGHRVIFRHAEQWELAGGAAPATGDAGEEQAIA